MQQCVYDGACKCTIFAAPVGLGVADPDGLGRGNKDCRLKDAASCAARTLLITSPGKPSAAEDWLLETQATLCKKAAINASALVGVEDALADPAIPCNFLFVVRRGIFDNMLMKLSKTIDTGGSSLSG